MKDVIIQNVSFPIGLVIKILIFFQQFRVVEYEMDDRACFEHF